MEQVAEAELTGNRPMARSRGARVALLAAGHTALALGVIGAFLPVMPSTVFLIVAASCYARGSTRFYRRLVNHRIFGPVIRDWETHRAMSRRAKVIAIAMIVLTFTVTVGFFLHTAWVRVIHVATGAVVISIILAIPTRRV